MCRPLNKLIDSRFDQTHRCTQFAGFVIVLALRHCVSNLLDGTRGVVKPCRPCQRACRLAADLTTPPANLTTSPAKTQAGTLISQPGLLFFRRERRSMAFEKAFARWQSRFARVARASANSMNPRLEPHVKAVSTCRILMVRFQTDKADP